jgi:hypothetical protein
MTSFLLNEKSVQVDVDPTTPLLWVLRDSLEMTGTKFGCGMALCGACTVHLDGRAIRSCVSPLSRVAGKRVTTIEGLSANLTHPLQKAWIELSSAFDFVFTCLSLCFSMLAYDCAGVSFCQTGNLLSSAACAPCSSGSHSPCSLINTVLPTNHFFDHCGP